MDDQSPDGTSAAVRRYSQGKPQVRLLERPGERGLSAAVLSGFGQAKGDILGVMDADGSHDENILPLLWKAIDAGAELAVGSRRLPGGGADRWPWYRRLTSDVATQLAKALLATPLSDPMSGYFLLKRALYLRCRDQLAARGYKILLEIACKGRPAKIHEIPFIFKDRHQGQSKMTPRIMKQYLESLWDLRTYRQ